MLGEAFFAGFHGVNDEYLLFGDNGIGKIHATIQWIITLYTIDLEIQSINCLMILLGQLDLHRDHPY